MKMGEWAYPKDKLSVVIFMTDSYIKALRDKGRKGSKSLMVIRTYALCAEREKTTYRLRISSQLSLYHMFCLETFAFSSRRKSERSAEGNLADPDNGAHE
jgi:hypothetical protein